MLELFCSSYKNLKLWPKFLEALQNKNFESWNVVTKTRSEITYAKPVTLRNILSNMKGIWYQILRYVKMFILFLKYFIGVTFTVLSHEINE